MIEGAMGGKSGPILQQNSMGAEAHDVTRCPLEPLDAQVLVWSHDFFAVEAFKDTYGITGIFEDDTLKLDFSAIKKVCASQTFIGRILIQTHIRQRVIS